MRQYVAAARRVIVDIDEEGASGLEDQFVAARATGRLPSRDAEGRLHQWVSVSKLKARALGSVNMNPPHYNDAFDLEEERANGFEGADKGLDAGHGAAASRCRSARSRIRVPLSAARWGLADSTKTGLLRHCRADSARRARGRRGRSMRCLVPRVDDVGRVRRHPSSPDVVEDGAAGAARLRPASGTCPAAAGGDCVGRFQLLTGSHHRRRRPRRASTRDSAPAPPSR